MAVSFSSSCSSYSHTPFSPSQSLSIRHITLPLPPYSQPLHFIGGFSRRFSPAIRARNSPSSLQVFSLHENKGGAGAGAGAGVVSGRSWEKMVLKSEMPVLVEFHASWCGPCRMVHRVIEEVATEYAGRLKCLVLHADNDLEVAESYDIKAVPVVLLFKNGKKHASIVGTMPKDFYVTAIESLLVLDR